MKTFLMPVLTNATLQSIEGNIHIIGFILGALDKGFSVRWPDCIVAKKGLCEVITHPDGERKEVSLFKGKTLILSFPVDEFRWHYLSMIKGRIYYKDKFLK